MGVIVRLLFWVMLEKRGRSRGADRCTAVLGMLGDADEELGMFMELLLRPVGSSSSVCRMACSRLRGVGDCHGLLPHRHAPRSIIDWISETCQYLKILTRRMLMHLEMSAGCLLPSQITGVRLRSLYVGICRTIHLLSPQPSIEKAPKHHRHCWIFSMCGPQHENLRVFDILHAASNVYLLGCDKR